jgi:hypothetical protein
VKAARAWSATRRNAAVMALLTATATAIGAAAAGGSAMYLLGAGAYLAIAAMAVTYPAWIAPQVIGGSGLVAALLTGPEPLGLLVLGALLAGVITTAEVLAGAARLDRPAAGDTRLDLGRSAGAALGGAAVFLLVALVARLPGPTGLLPTAIAAAGCVLLALLLTRLADSA